MRKEIEDISINDAKEIFKWSIASVSPKEAYDDAYILRTVRNYLRSMRRSPADELEAVRKLKSSMPKRIF